MKYLITGFSGFMGSHLTERLLNDGHEVIGIDRSIKFKNIVANHPNLRMYHMDIFDNIADLFKDIDYVYHLAALTRPQWSIKYPYETTQTNLLGTLKILEYCRDNNIKKIIFASTSDIYGDQAIYPTPEDVVPNPLNYYALSKWMGEKACELFHTLYGLKYNIIRPFNAYGPRMPLSGIWTSAVATFIDALVNNKKFKTFGDGNQKRDFIYIDDLVDMLILLANDKVDNNAFNCGSGSNNSINEIREIIEKITGKTVEFERLPAQFEKKETLANISKADILLGWKPKISLEEGLKRTVQSYL